MNTRRENKVPLHLIAGVFLFLGTFTIVLDTKSANASIADHLVINEIQTDSLGGTGGSSDDWIELYNPTNTAIVLDGYSIQKHSALSTSAISKKILSGTIPAGGYYLVVRGDDSTSQLLKDKADALTTSSFSLSSDNTIYLVKNDVNIVDKFDTDIIDILGIGTAEVFEGPAGAANPAETKSISRIPDGEDTDNNLVDFKISDSPSPQNIASSDIPDDEDIDGKVLVTVVNSGDNVRNIMPTSAEIVFSVNSVATVKVNYGLNSSYNLTSADITSVANSETSISLTGLSCGTTYHYSVYASITANGDTHSTDDASFSTLPCGMKLDSLTMTKSSARANNQFVDGWNWEFKITVWDLDETKLKMKFGQWAGLSTLSAGDNMQYSVDSVMWQNITANDIYPVETINISSIDDDLVKTGRQVTIKVRMKVPVGTLAGDYKSDYGILIEK